MKKSHTGLKNTSEANRKIGEANKRRVITPGFRAKRAEIGRRRLGKHFGPMSEQGRKNVSEGKKGKRTGPWARPMSEQGRLNISKARLGKSTGPRSPETREKIRVAKLAYWAERKAH
jgi:hypothetical protein